MRRTRRSTAAFVTTVMLILTVMTVSAPAASAALPSGCSIAVTVPSTDGVFVTSSTKITCSASYALWARAAVDEKIGAVWNNVQGGWSTEASTSGTTVTAYKSFNCNGHGTDFWRGRGKGGTGTNTTETTSGSVSLTC